MSARLHAHNFKDPARQPPPATGSSALNHVRRSHELDELSQLKAPVDVLVIGGGVTGAGIALDAASRGLSVVLAESHDLAFGTSRWSSKLVHGGLRYLASGDFGVARESARERHLLMTSIAPHLTRALSQLLPFVPAVSRKQRIVARVGFLLGDGLRRQAGTASTVLASPRRVSSTQALELFAGLQREGLRGGILSTDGQLVDDAKLVTEIARTAAAYGAKILTRVRVSEASGDGALLTDTLSGSSLRIPARSVVNATGVWAPEIDPAIRLRPSRGTHIVLDAKTLGNPRVALTVPHPGSTSRYVFALPQGLDRVLVGLTDEEAPGPVPDVPLPTEQEINFLLSTISRVLDRPLERADVRGAFAGLRPLLDDDGATSDVSRKHLVTVSELGIINVLGGKLTTYRVMAEDAVNLAAEIAGFEVRPCATKALALVGAPGSPAAHRALSLKAYAISDPGSPIAPAISVSRAQIAHAIINEGALDADDVLDRRTRIGLVAEDRERAHAAVTQLVEEVGQALSRRS